MGNAGSAQGFGKTAKFVYALGAGDATVRGERFGPDMDDLKRLSPSRRS